MRGNKKIRTVLLNDTRVDRHHGCSTVLSVIFTLARKVGIDIVATAPAHVDWRKNPEIINAIAGADLVLINGEGTIHHNRSAGEYLLAAASHARDLNIPAALINTTWQANGPVYTDMARAFSLISVRETASAAELSAAGIKSRTIPDFALFNPSHQSVERHGICYTDSVLGANVLILDQRMGSLGAEPIAILYDRKRPRDFAVSLRRFLPGRDVLDPRKALAACRAAITDMTSQIDDRNEFIEKISQSRLIVTGRFHVLILALATRTPFLVIASNTHKNRATVQDSGLGMWRHVEIEEIDDALLERASKWHDGEGELLDKYLKKSRADMQALFDDLRELVQ